MSFTRAKVSTYGISCSHWPCWVHFLFLWLRLLLVSSATSHAGCSAHWNLSVLPERLSSSQFPFCKHKSPDEERQSLHLSFWSLPLPSASSSLNAAMGAWCLFSRAETWWQTELIDLIFCCMEVDDWLCVESFAAGQLLLQALILFKQLLFLTYSKVPPPIRTMIVGVVLSFPSISFLSSFVLSRINKEMHLFITKCRKSVGPVVLTGEQ